MRNKLINIFFAIMVVSSSASSQLTLNHVLTEAHNQAFELHNLMESHFDRMRNMVSQQLSIISEHSLEHILNGIMQIESIRLETIRLINLDKLSGNGKPIIISNENSNTICFETLFKLFNDDLEEIGSAISRCSWQTDIALRNLIISYSNANVQPQKLSVDLLNIVLDQFGAMSVLDDVYKIQRELDEVIIEARSTFTGTTLPYLSGQLEIVANQTIVIPLATKECVHQSLNELSEKQRTLLKSSKNNCS